MAADVERLIAREGVAPGADRRSLVPDVSARGQAVAVALEERAVPHRVVGEAAFFQRAEIRDVLAWLRLLADAVGRRRRWCGRWPGRRSSCARSTSPAAPRSRGGASSTWSPRWPPRLESPQVPPEARERIRVFLKLYRAGVAAIDTTRPDLYVHRLIERLGLRRQQLFAAQADVVERLRALGRLRRAGAASTRGARPRPRRVSSPARSPRWPTSGCASTEEPSLAAPAPSRS